MLACTIPLVVTILAADPCATWTHIQQEWHEADVRLAYTHEMLGWEYRHIPMDIYPIVFEERPDQWDGLAGLFQPPPLVLYDPPPFRIQWSAVHEPLILTLRHEITHFLEYLQFTGYWLDALHGTVRDPFIMALNNVILWNWPVPHSYRPGLLGRQ